MFTNGTGQSESRSLEAKISAADLCPVARLSDDRFASAGLHRSERADSRGDRGDPGSRGRDGEAGPADREDHPGRGRRGVRDAAEVGEECLKVSKRWTLHSVQKCLTDTT